MRLPSAQPYSYRSDIDGLRAVAVIAVVISHFFPDLLPGGYVGVDLFFVISGYLISSLIFKALIDNSFSFSDFYERRVKRLFPNLLAILFFVAIAGWFFCLPFDYESLGELMTAATTFSSNLLLAKGSSYFNIESTYKPLLHLWSLSLEEQFYILFPPSVVFFFKKKQNWLLSVLILSLIISFAVNIYFTNSKPIKAFYLLPSRGWELLFGTLWSYICCFRQSSPFFKWVQTYSIVLSILGFALVIYSIITFHDKLIFPGWYALLPTSGALLLIMTPQSWINRRLLSQNFVVQIGLISYALYLWHWPLLSFAQLYSEGRVSSLARLSLLGASLTLAWISTWYVEKPFRAASSKMFCPLIGLMIIVFGLSCLISHHILKPLTSHLNPAISQIQVALKDWIVYKPSPKNHGAFPFIYFGEGPEIILFFGDSNVEQYQPRVEKLMDDHLDLRQRYTAIFAYQRCQIPLLDHPNGEKAVRFMAQVEAFLKKPAVTTVVVGAEWMGYIRGFPDKASAYYDSLKRLLAQLHTAEKNVYLILNIPVGMQFHPRQQLTRRGPLDWQLNSLRTVDDTLWFQRSQPITDRLKTLAQATGAHVIDPCDTLCPNHQCLLMDVNNTPIYRDDSHLTSSYVREHATFIDQIFPK